MAKILFLKGLPASGKSSFAKDLVKKDGNWIRVSKDDFRAMLHDKKWSREREKTVEFIQVSAACEALSKGKNVVVDNTHLSPRHENIWRDIAKQYDAEFEVKEFDTSIDECLKRDQERGIASGAVGKDVILRMFYQHNCDEYDPPEGLQKAIICDIDGTLAFMRDRGPFEWDKVGNDALNKPLAQILSVLRESGITIVLLSGRDSCCRKETENWLDEYNVLYDELYMRPEGSMEPDTIVKQRLFDQNALADYEIFAVFDDRPCMVRMWRQMGFFVFDCGNGIEF